MKTIERKIELEGVKAEIEGNLIRITGPKGTVERKITDKSIKISKEDNVIIITAMNPKRKCKRMMETMRAHIKNMIKGVKEGYEYKLKICSTHFPINVSISGKDVIIKNFLGEKHPRVCKIKYDVDVKLEKDFIIISGIDKEKVGQAAADLEQTTRITNRDRRVFMDGIYIVSKG